MINTYRPLRVIRFDKICLRCLTDKKYSFHSVMGEGYIT
jgi:hypothetical protein